MVFLIFLCNGLNETFGYLVRSEIALWAKHFIVNVHR